MSGDRRVVIVGGGFGGLYAAKSLRRAPVSVTLVDRRNFHLFQPLLYQVATGGLSPADIAAPLRSVLGRQKNTRVLLGEVAGFDIVERKVLLPDGEVPYDLLVVAAGSSHHYFGHPEWERFAPGLKSVEDATEIRRRILMAFESAERETSEKARQDWLRFIIVGGGPTGVELGGALAEIARDTLRHDFRAIDPTSARIQLVEGAERVLPAYPPDLSEKARRSLEELGVEVRTSAFVTEILEDRITIRTEAGDESMPSRTVLWAAGVQGSPLGRALASAAGSEVDPAGRVKVDARLNLPGHPEIFVVGDLALFTTEAGMALPAVAPVAMQQGKYAASVIRSRLKGKGEKKGFRYKDYGSLATIGRSKAVADFGRVRFSGYPAWLTWLFVHLMKMVEFENRLLVFLQWLWAYFTFNRSARLITGRALLPDLAHTSREKTEDGKENGRGKA